MSIQFSNLQYSIAQADNSQAFQTQHAILNHGLRAADADADVKRADEKATTVEEQEEKDQVDKDGRQGNASYWALRNGETPPEGESEKTPKILPPTGEGGLIDIMA